MINMDTSSWSPGQSPGCSRLLCWRLLVFLTLPAFSYFVFLMSSHIPCHQTELLPTLNFETLQGIALVPSLTLLQGSQLCCPIRHSHPGLRVLFTVLLHGCVSDSHPLSMNCLSLSVYYILERPLTPCHAHPAIWHCSVCV